MSKQSVKTPERPPLRFPELNARMRARRSQHGITGADLAERAGISASYVSLIESGAKIPDEQVAADIARALDDDEDLYRALARAARLGPRKLDLLTRLEAASRTPAFVTLVESGQSLPRLAEPESGAEDLALRMREVARRLSSPSPSARDLTGSPSVASIPVLAEGADPARIDETGTAVADRLLLDRRLLAPAATGLFACVVVAGDMRHLRGLAEPGDRVVFERGAHLAPDRICAVRTGGRLVLTRVLRSGGALLLLPGEGETGFESLELPEGDTLADRVVGTHVLLIRH